MTKRDFVAAIAQDTGMKRDDVMQVVDATWRALTDCLAKGDKLTIAGFGTFSAVEKPESTAMNLITREKVVVPAHKSPRFKASKTLKDHINR